MPDYCFNKISGLQPAVLLRKSPAQLFLVIIPKFFRTAFFKRTIERLLLENCILSFSQILKLNKMIVICTSLAEHFTVKTIEIC